MPTRSSARWDSSVCRRCATSRAPRTTPGFVLQLARAARSDASRGSSSSRSAENDLLAHDARCVVARRRCSTAADDAATRDRCSARSSSAWKTRCSSGARCSMQANSRSAVLHADASLTAAAAECADRALTKSARFGVDASRRRTASVSPQRLGRKSRSAVELLAFDAQWSEHCCYKSSRHFLRRLPTETRRTVLGPGEDAGILHLGTHDGERYGVVIAHESHNHPSQVVPFEGAATGIGGIVRDVLCMGAEVIGVADPLRFGRSRIPIRIRLRRARRRRRNRRLRQRDRRSESWPATSTSTRASTTTCWSTSSRLGSSRKIEIIHSLAPKGADGWDIVLVGKATDPSGFGGASFSSLDARRCAMPKLNKGAVQVPDPFLKNVLMRASYRVFAVLREHGVDGGLQGSRRRRHRGLFGGDDRRRRLRRGDRSRPGATSRSKACRPK